MKVALGYECGCIGLRIWLHRVTDMTASGYEYDCIELRIWLVSGSAFIPCIIQKKAVTAD